MAVSAGLPILFAGSGEGSKVVDDREIGWTSPPGDVDKLRDNLRALQTVGKEGYERIRQNCREVSEGEFNFARQAERLTTRLQDLATNERGVE